MEALHSIAVMRNETHSFKVRVLIAECGEDERSDRLLLSLSAFGYGVDVAYSPATAGAAIARGDTDVVIVDLTTAHMHGLKLIRSIRQHEITIPILALSTHAEISTRIEALDAGADDYLIEPIDPAELDAHVRALLRRIWPPESSRNQIGSFVLESEQRRLIHGHTIIALTQNEVALLELFASIRNERISKKKIARALANGPYRPSDSAIEIAIHRLRAKLNPYQLTIRVRRNVGYQIEHALRDDL